MFAHTCDYEQCIICGQNTHVPKSTDIADRKFYITGCGQLCQECYLELINNNF